jgi:DNA (cytosine-5)-methyltransferase 1
MGAVLGGLADLGYDAEWESIPAAAVGAPHLRYRVWIVGYLAHADDVGGLGNGGLPGNGDASQWDDAYRRGRAAAVAYADGLGLGRQAALGSSGLTRLRPGEAGPEPDGASHGALADADLAGPQGHGRLDPERDCAGEWPAGSGGGTLDGQWLTEPDVGRVAHGVPARVDRLRALGNAVVPQVVEFIGRRILEAEAVS